MPLFNGNKNTKATLCLVRRNTRSNTVIPGNPNQANTYAAITTQQVAQTFSLAQIPMQHAPVSTQHQQIYPNLSASDSTSPSTSPLEPSAPQQPQLALPTTSTVRRSLNPEMAAAAPPRVVLNYDSADADLLDVVDAGLQCIIPSQAYGQERFQTAPDDDADLHRNMLRLQVPDGATAAATADTELKTTVSTTTRNADHRPKTPVTTPTIQQDSGRQSNVGIEIVNGRTLVLYNSDIDFHDAARRLERVLSRNRSKDLDQHMYQDDIDNFVHHACNIDLEPYPCVASAVQHMRNIYYDRLQVQEQDRDDVDVGSQDIADNTDPDIVFDYNARERRSNRIPFQNEEEVDLDDTLPYDDPDSVDEGVDIESDQYSGESDADTLVTAQDYLDDDEGPYFDERDTEAMNRFRHDLEVPPPYEEVAQSSQGRRFTNQIPYRTNSLVGQMEDYFQEDLIDEEIYGQGTTHRNRLPGFETTTSTGTHTYYEHDTIPTRRHPASPGTGTHTITYGPEYGHEVGLELDAGNPRRNRRGARGRGNPPGQPAGVGRGGGAGRGQPPAPVRGRGNPAAGRGNRGRAPQRGGGANRGGRNPPRLGVPRPQPIVAAGPNPQPPRRNPRRAARPGAGNNPPPPGGPGGNPGGGGGGAGNPGGPGGNPGGPGGNPGGPGGNPGGPGGNPGGPGGNLPNAPNPPNPPNPPNNNNNQPNPAAPGGNPGGGGGNPGGGGGGGNPGGGNNADGDSSDDDAVDPNLPPLEAILHRLVKAQERTKKINKRSKRFEQFPSDKFDGTDSTQGHAHWKNFMRYWRHVTGMKYVDVNYNEFKKVFLLSLAGIAYTWFLNCKDDYATLLDFKSGFLRRFNKWGQTVKQLNTAWNKMKFDIMKDDVEIFTDDLRLLSSMLYMTQDQTLEKFKDSFDADISSHLITAPTLSVAKAKAEQLVFIYQNKVTPAPTSLLIHETAGSQSAHEHQLAPVSNNNDKKGNFSRGRGYSNQRRGGQSVSRYNDKQNDRTQHKNDNYNRGGGTSFRRPRGGSYNNMGNRGRPYKPYNNYPSNNNQNNRFNRRFQSRGRPYRKPWTQRGNRGQYMNSKPFAQRYAEQGNPNYGGIPQYKYICNVCGNKGHYDHQCHTAHQVMQHIYPVAAQGKQPLNPQAAPYYNNQPPQGQGQVDSQYGHDTAPDHSPF